MIVLSLCRAEMKAEIRQLKQDLTGKKPKTEEVKEEEAEDKDSDTIKEYKKEREK